ncbi:MAG: hypothetical protein A4E66_01769 [Syntrophus sp. PtaB.Bin001]|nr:MAG: hypothetical protein A4E66_01769 [Syntrophus sp. PtaB.Bin001]
MGRIVKITDSTGECIEIHYDDDGNIIKKNISQQLGNNSKLNNTGNASNKNLSSEPEVKSINVDATSHNDARVKDLQTGINNIIANKTQNSDHKISHNIDEAVNDQNITTENYKEQYENFRKIHPTLSKNRSSDFPDKDDNSSLGRYKIIIIAIVAVIILAVGIIYKCNNRNNTSNPNSSTSKNDSIQSQTKEANSGQKMAQESQESPGESVTKPTATNIFKMNLEQPPPPDCKVKLLNPIVILPNGDQVQATIFKIKVDGKELTGWTVDSYPLGSRFTCSATCE